MVLTRIVSDKCGIHGSEDSYSMQCSGLLHVSGTVVTDVSKKHSAPILW